MVTFVTVRLHKTNRKNHPKYKRMNSQHSAGPLREDISEYVAHLQLHMALQARNLVPTLTQVSNSREQLLQKTQADFEKQVSRQPIDPNIYS